jgi:DNA-binding transcriptional LysR family regulator
VRWGLLDDALGTVDDASSGRVAARMEDDGGANSRTLPVGGAAIGRSFGRFRATYAPARCAMSLTLDHLRILVAAADAGSLAGAARAVHRVPSAVTYQVRELEHALALTLFERRGRTMVLTGEGARVLSRAREILARCDDLHQLATELRAGWEPALTVVVDGALPVDLLIPCVRVFADRRIPTRLRVDTAFQEGVLDPLVDGVAQVGLYLGFDTEAEAAGWQRTPLPRLRMVLVASPQLGDAADRAPELVVRDSAERFRAQDKASFSGATQMIYLPDFAAKRASLLAGVGIGWMPSHLVRDDLARGALVQLDRPSNEWTYAPQVVSRRDTALGPAGQLFVDTLLEATRDFEIFE